jgi:hypothetical protein
MTKEELEQKVAELEERVRMLEAKNVTVWPPATRSMPHPLYGWYTVTANR